MEIIDFDIAYGQTKLTLHVSRNEHLTCDATLRLWDKCKPKEELFCEVIKDACGTTSRTWGRRPVANTTVVTYHKTTDDDFGRPMFYLDRLIGKLGTELEGDLTIHSATGEEFVYCVRATKQTSFGHASIKAKTYGGCNIC